MLIIYRTNAGFEGDIVSLDRSTPAVAMDVYLAARDDAELAYIEVAESAVTAETLGALVSSVEGYGEGGRFYVAEIDGVMSLVDGGV